ncbi:MAG: hypothetical protein ABSG22_10545 [Sedimentisphaerales bacterium]|jgi:alpha-tubulin suppressor-like RCC1 family protein
MAQTYILRGKNYRAGIGWGTDANYNTVFPTNNYVDKIAAGGGNSVFLTSDGEIIERNSWDNIAEAEDRPAPTGKGYTYISAGKGAWGLAVKADGSIVQWGQKNAMPTVGGLGVTILDPPSGTDFIAVAAGTSFGLALKSDGSIVGWGYDSHGQIASIPAGYNFTVIVAGEAHGVALKTDGSIIAWGWNGDHQTDYPSVIGDNIFTAITAGWRHNLALRKDGSIVGWGTNSYGETTCPSGNSFIAIAAGYLHSLALRKDGSLRGWGLGYSALVKPPAGTGYTAIAAGVGFGLALKISNHTIYPWAPVGSPMLTFSGYAFDKMTAGVAHAIARKTDGSLYAWSDNTYGQTDCPAGTDYDKIAAGKQHSIALKIDRSTIVGWGDSDFWSPCPPAIFGGTPIVYINIAAGWYHNLAIHEHGAGNGQGYIVAWGNNDSGQCDVPDISIYQDFIAVAAGEAHSLGLRIGGSIKAWGDNTYGQASCSPGTFTAIAAGRRHSLGLKSDGSIVAWGDNSNGQCDFPAGIDFIAIAAGGNMSVALKSDGSIIAWGDDGGQADIPQGNNFKAIAAGYYQRLAVNSIITVKGIGYNRTTQKRRVTRAARCVLDYTGSISITFSGITITTKFQGNPILPSWSDPNRTFIVPRRDNWDPDAGEPEKWIWQTATWPIVPIDGWVVSFTFDDHYIAAIKNPNAVGVCGQLLLYRNDGGITWGVAFEAHSHGKEIYTLRPLLGSPTVDIGRGKKSYLPGGRYRDIISVNIRNTIISSDMNNPPGDGYMGLDGAIGYGGKAVIDGSGGLFHKEFGT